MEAGTVEGRDCAGCRWRGADGVCAVWDAALAARRPALADRIEAWVALVRGTVGWTDDGLPRGAVPPCPGYDGPGGSNA